MRKLFVIAIALVLSLNSFAQELKSGMINLDCKIDVTLKSGYTHSQVFVLKGEKFLFSHDSKTGQTDIWNLEVGGLPKFSKKWSTGWTNIDFYEYKGEVYFFHQKGDEGTARINKLDYNSIMNDIEMGAKVFEAKWSKGWTTTKFFVHNDVVYFLHYKADNGLARLNAANQGGDIGTMIYEKTWAKGYTNFAMTANKDNFFILYQRSDEGTCVINNIDLPKLESAAKAGLLSPNLGAEAYRNKWTTGWTHIEFFTLNNEVYMFHNKADEGTARITKLNPDGTLGKHYYDQKWSSGWTSFNIFYMNGKPQLMHQKRKTGQTKICELKF